MRHEAASDSQPPDSNDKGGRQVEKGDNIDPNPHGDKTTDSVQEDVEVGELGLKVSDRLDESGVSDGNEG